MKRLLLIAALLSAHRTQAADISLLSEPGSDRPQIIRITGQIVDWDDASSGALAGYQRKPAIVFLDSRGGSAMIAVQIGLLIQKYGFSTAVADGAICSSGCALIWVAGKERFMGP